MRTYYQPETTDFWLDLLVDQQYGSGYPHFTGTQYQRGAGIGSFFRGLFRAVAPIAKSVGRTVGRQALKAGANILADTAQGRNIRESLKEHGKAAIGTALRETGALIDGQHGHGFKERQLIKVKQIGKGIGSRKGLKRDQIANRKRKRDIYDGGSIA